MIKINAKKYAPNSPFSCSSIVIPDGIISYCTSPVSDKTANNADAGNVDVYFINNLVGIIMGFTY